MSLGWMQDTDYFKREHEESKLRLFGGSWSLNLDELKELVHGYKDIDLLSKHTYDYLPIKNIVLLTDKYIYKITYEKALAKGIPKKYWGENKIVVPIMYWDRESQEIVK